MSADLIKSINEFFGDRLNYKPYNIRTTDILYGTPPVPIKGWQYLAAKHDAPQTRLVKSLTSGGVFVSNQCSAGTIEIGLLANSVSVAAIQVIELLGIPFPILVNDKDAILSTVVASACRRVDTPEWRRESTPGINVFTFATPRLLISDGLRLPA